MKTIWKSIAGICIAFSGMSLLTAPFAGAITLKELRTALTATGIKNVIVMVPDGCDETVQTVARWYKGQDLRLDSMQGGGVKTHMADSIIPDSAAAATAFACGHKTSDGFVGVGPRTDTLLTGYLPTAKPYAPIISVLEAAKQLGKSTGIAVTCRISHATPAGFASHVDNRDLENEITEQMVYNNIDVVFGGGARHLIPSGSAYTTSFGATWSGKRTDGEDLMEVLKQRGYQFVDHKYDMASVNYGKVWGLFSDSHMEPDMDRQYFAANQPSLAEMTAKAIQLLSQNPNGFFLHVEGSQVDWAGHANDPIYMVTDFLAFDEAVKVACDFADKEGNTLVLAFPDHNTGGMKIGSYYTPMGYTQTKIEDLVNPLKGMKITSAGLVRVMDANGDNQISDAELIEGIQNYWSITISEEELKAIREQEPSVGLSYAIAKIVSAGHTVIGWTTHGHNGETVPFWVYGAELPVGIIDDTELARIEAAAIGVNLDQMTSQLYVDVSQIKGFEMDLATDPENPVLKLGGATLPVDKDYALFGSSILQFPGLTIYAPATKKAYLSTEALAALGVAY